VTVPPPPVVRKHPKTNVKAKARAKARAKAKAKRAAIRPTPPSKPVKRAKPRPVLVSPRVRNVSEVDSSSSPMIVQLGLGFTFALSLVFVGLAVAPFRALPGAVQSVAYNRREPLLYTGIVIYITTGVSLAIALLLS
jgi:hypothetical protein